MGPLRPGATLRRLNRTIESRFRIARLSIRSECRSECHYDFLSLPSLQKLVGEIFLCFWRAILVRRLSGVGHSHSFSVTVSGKSKWGLSKWGLKALVHNCPQSPTIVVILQLKFPLERGPKKATKVHNCRRLCANCREWP